MIRKRDRGYWLNVALGFDQFIAAILGYNADVSISAALGEVQWLEYHGKNIGWRKPIKALLQRALLKAEPQHCLRAYLYELSKRPEENKAIIDNLKAIKGVI